MITVLDQAIPDKLLARVATDLSQCRFSYGWRSNLNLGFGHWHEDIVDAGTQNTEDLSTWLDLAGLSRGSNAIGDLWRHFSTTALSGHDLLRCYVNAHTYGTEGYPHKDAERTGEVTTLTYMNPEWKKEWAGETVFFDGAGEIVRAVLPRHGRVVRFSSEMEHCARPVSRTCPVLRVTLVFKSRAPDPSEMTPQEFLRIIGAFEVPHSGRRLSDHLNATHDMLRLHGHSEAVCLAGLIHSIYGTSALPHACQDPTARLQVRRVVGDRAEYLAWLFSILNRPAALEAALTSTAGDSVALATRDGGLIMVDYQTLLDLCAMEAANLLEQNLLDKCTNLLAFWGAKGL
jgi:hypothetical protein